MGKRRKTYTALLAVFILLACAAAAYMLKDHANLLQKLKDGQGEHYRVVVFGDTRGKDGVNERVLESVLEQIKKLVPQPKYIFVPGDLVSGSEDKDELKDQLEDFKQIFSSYYPVEMLMPTVGNHEVGNEPSGPAAEEVFAQVFSEFKPNGILKGYNKTSYYVDLGSTRFIVLNSYHYGEGNKIAGKQFKWLQEVLKVPQKHKFVLLHSPAYPLGGHIGTSLDAYPRLRDRFWQEIDKNKVTAVFAAHEHNYARRLVDSSFSTDEYKFRRKINQVIAGTAGAPFETKYEDSKGVVVPPTPCYHFVVIDIQGSIVNVRAISVDGIVIDKFSIK